MARTTARQGMTPAEAKQRLSELGGKSTSFSVSPARVAALLAFAFVAGRFGGGRIGCARSMGHLVKQAGLVAAPVLVERFVRGVASQLNRK